MQTAPFVVGGLVAGVVAIGVVFVVGMRTNSRPVLDAVRRTSRAVKPLVLRSAGTAGSPTSVVRHEGRTSGRTYETPVVGVPAEGGFVIALPYGPNTDWLKNVLAAGHATIVFDGRNYEVDRPEVVAIDDVDAHFAPKERRLHRQFRIHDALRVRAYSDRPSRSLVA
jgi:deazaflavin-dependent oxidoreductase (nitroreductase family)